MGASPALYASVTDQLPLATPTASNSLLQGRHTARDAATGLYTRLCKECQTTGIAIWNYEFDYQRSKIVEAGALENYHTYGMTRHRHPTPP